MRDRVQLAEQILREFAIEQKEQRKAPLSGIADTKSPIFTRRTSFPTATTSPANS
jgi:hypothetical protein